MLSCSAPTTEKPQLIKRETKRERARDRKREREREREQRMEEERVQAKGVKYAELLW